MLGFRHIGTEGDWHRFAVGAGGTGEYLDVREVPADTRRGAWGVGSIHHLAWRVADEAEQLAVRTQVDGAGRRPTPVIDRFWFKSVYFLEPGGVLFELATDGPGFAVDEDPKHLGESLVLPPWLESQRAGIAAGLPPLSMPAGRQLTVSARGGVPLASSPCTEPRCDAGGYNGRPDDTVRLKTTTRSSGVATTNATTAIPTAAIVAASAAVTRTARPHARPCAGPATDGAGREAVVPDR